MSSYVSSRYVERAATSSEPRNSSTVTECAGTVQTKGRRSRANVFSGMHYALHIGRITFLAKHLQSSRWVLLNIPRGKSGDFNPRVASVQASQR